MVLDRRHSGTAVVGGGRTGPSRPLGHQHRTRATPIPPDPTRVHPKVLDPPIHRGIVGVVPRPPGLEFPAAPDNAQPRQARDAAAGTATGSGSHEPPPPMATSAPVVFTPASAGRAREALWPARRGRSQKGGARPARTAAAERSLGQGCGDDSPGGSPAPPACPPAVRPPPYGKISKRPMPSRGRAWPADPVPSRSSSATTGRQDRMRADDSMASPPPAATSGTRRAGAPEPSSLTGDHASATARPSRSRPPDPHQTGSSETAAASAADTATGRSRPPVLAAGRTGTAARTGTGGPAKVRREQQRQDTTPQPNRSHPGVPYRPLHALPAPTPQPRPTPSAYTDRSSPPTGPKQGSPRYPRQPAPPPPHGQRVRSHYHARRRPNPSAPEPTHQGVQHPTPEPQQNPVPAPPTDEPPPAPHTGRPCPALRQAAHEPRSAQPSPAA